MITLSVITLSSAYCITNKISALDSKLALLYTITDSVIAYLSLYSKLLHY